MARDLECRPASVDEPAAAPEEPALGSVVALIVVVVACMLLAVLPAAVALQAPALPEGWVAAGAGGFVGVIFSFKLAAGAWGVAERLWSAYQVRVVSGNVDFIRPWSRPEPLAALVCAAEEVI